MKYLPQCSVLITEDLLVDTLVFTEKSKSNCCVHIMKPKITVIGVFEFPMRFCLLGFHLQTGLVCPFSIIAADIPKIDIKIVFFLLFYFIPNQVEKMFLPNPADTIRRWGGERRLVKIVFLSDLDITCQAMKTFLTVITWEEGVSKTLFHGRSAKLYGIKKR